MVHVCLGCVICSLCFSVQEACSASGDITQTAGLHCESFLGVLSVRGGEIPPAWRPIQQRACSEEETVGGREQCH